MKILRKQLFPPEVIQTSAMDCGPASLKCLLEGHGIRAAYGRLREACQIDVDGTSIDSLEEVCNQLGLAAEQVMLPADHVTLPQSNSLPAIVVVRLPNNNTHFIVVWRKIGPFVQIMDPAGGRRWISAAELNNKLYIHKLAVSSDSWRDWAGSDEFVECLKHRMTVAGILRPTRERLIELARRDVTWKTFASLDAVTRMVDSIVKSGGLRKGQEATRGLRHLLTRTDVIDGFEVHSVPGDFWSAKGGADEADGTEQLHIRGAVLLRVTVKSNQDSTPLTSGSQLSPEMIAAIAEAQIRPGALLLKLFGATGVLANVILLLLTIFSSFGVVLESLLLRGLFDLSQSLRLQEQRLGAVSAIVLIIAIVLMLEWVVASGSRRVGRQFEGRLRLELLKKIPRLGDQYFHSRLTSDMAERSHALHTLREVPNQAVRVIRSFSDITFCTAGLIWIDPANISMVLVLSASMLILPLISQPLFTRLELQVRTHVGALSRFYMDSLRGLAAIRMHAAGRAVRGEHEGVLVEWLRSAFRMRWTTATLEGLQLFVGFILAVWLLHLHLKHQVNSAESLLFAYWGLNLASSGQEISVALRQYPVYRNVVLRVLEPLGAADDAFVSSVEAVKPAAPNKRSVSIDMDNVSVNAGGHLILQSINLSVRAGGHVAVLGASGAGKSSLLGTLLGLYRPATGRILIDGLPLTAESIRTLRDETRWVDPAVQLWNETLWQNLRYGSSSVDVQSTQILNAADLHGLLEKLPLGLQTPLGEGGILLSAGEGQRVRFGRAIYRQNPRLVILDEPFRGLDRERRRQLLVRARMLWRSATLFCVTHDVSETLDFDRVILVDNGQIVEDGNPRSLMGSPNSKYKALLDAEKSAVDCIWSNPEWRRLRIANGILIEQRD